MPELPEIEHLRTTLEPEVLGRRVRAVQLRRPDVIRCDGGRQPGSARPACLLRGAVIVELQRHGKQLALVSDRGSVVCIHLGMSGQLRFIPHRVRLPRTDHVHCVWRLVRVADGRATGRLVFRDPRRFGGLWLIPSTEALHAGRWRALGPDALAVNAASLRERLSRTSRSIKSALLDQSLVAGLGNIYVDEVLFAAGIHSCSVAAALPDAMVDKLTTSIHAILRHAIAAGGSSLRDYVDAAGRAGVFARHHRVYGRSGQPCLRCGRRLQRCLVAQRTTVLCSGCQRCFGRPQTIRRMNEERKKENLLSSP